MAEVQSHKQNAFVTLTYSDKNIWSPMGRPSLQPLHLKLFWKRLRRDGHSIRYYACGEYGDKTERPHYHAIICNYWPDDAIRHGSSSGHPSYTSESLNRAWGIGRGKKQIQFGHCLVEHVNLGSASYVAGYVSKKLFGRLAAEHYSDRVPPFVVQSQSLGRDYLSRYLSDALTGVISIPNPDGSARQVPVPRAWLSRLQRMPTVEDLSQPHTWSDYTSLKKIRAAKRQPEHEDYYIQYRHELSHELITLTQRALRARPGEQL